MNQRLYINCTEEMWWWDHLRQGEEERQQGWDEGQEEKEKPVHLSVGVPCRRDGALPLGPVAERGVATGNADRVELPGAELLVARGGD